MSTIAIIGADGAGKTTIAQKLETSFSIPAKYIYLGANIESSNFALPTSRLMLRLKLRSYKKIAKRSGITDPDFVSTHHIAHRNVKYGKIGGALRTLNRLAEAWFRQFISWGYQLQGFIIIYDRHFQFDAGSPNVKYKRLTDKLYYWILTHLYPQPHLVIFLDAPPEILLARKGEGTLDYLQRRRETYIAQGKEMDNFIRVDAAQPFDKVLTEVSQYILKFYLAKNPQKVHSSS